MAIESVSQTAGAHKRRRRGDHMQGSAIDRLPPHSPEAEQGVLGCLLLSPNGAITQAENALGRDAHAFYDLRNQTIFTAIVGMHDRTEAIDIITLQQNLKNRQLLETVGGIAYISELPDTVPSAANLSYYLEIVAEKYVLRKLIHLCTDVVGRVYDFEGELPALVEEVHRDITGIMAPVSRNATEDEWTFDDLMTYDVEHDENAILGWHDGKATRYLCRGYPAWIIGQSGIGKSSLGQQQCLFWSLGRPFCGITPVRPLRVLVVQSENDIGDSAESTQGIINSCQFDKSDYEQLRERFKVIRCRGRTGQDFCRWLEAKVNAWRADLVYIDPLLRFAGIDVSRQDQCTKFLNDCLDPVLARTGVVMIGAHHTGKPKSRKDTQGWTIYDRAYAGIGSSELVNWARAVTIVEAMPDGNFEMLLAKRGGRAWATHPGIDEPVSTLYLQHARDRIFWVQIDPPQEPDRKPRSAAEKGGRPNKIQEIATRNLHSFCANCKAEGETRLDVSRRLEKFLAAERVDASDKTCKRAIEALVANGKLTKTEAGLYVKGPEA